MAALVMLNSKGRGVGGGAFNEVLYGGGAPP